MPLHNRRARKNRSVQRDSTTHTAEPRQAANPHYCRTAVSSLYTPRNVDVSLNSLSPFLHRLCPSSLALPSLCLSSLHCLSPDVGDNMAASSLAGCTLAAIFLFGLQSTILSGEKILGEENDDFDFDGLPGVQHEFKVEVPGGVEECFFQRAATGAKLHVSFEVSVVP